MISGSQVCALPLFTSQPVATSKGADYVRLSLNEYAVKLGWLGYALMAAVGGAGGYLLRGRRSNSSSMNGTTTYDEEIHFHCVSTSTDPEVINADRYFTNIEDAQIFAEAKLKQFAAVWLWERGDCGRPGYEDVWITYWWNDLLAKDYGFGPPEGRGKGWVNWMEGKLPPDLKNSIHAYVPLDQTAKA